MSSNSKNRLEVRIDGLNARCCLSFSLGVVCKGETDGSIRPRNRSFLFAATTAPLSGSRRLQDKRTSSASPRNIDPNPRFNFLRPRRSATAKRHALNIVHHACRRTWSIGRDVGYKCVRQSERDISRGYLWCTFDILSVDHTAHTLPSRF